MTRRLLLLWPFVLGACTSTTPPPPAEYLLSSTIAADAGGARSHEHYAAALGRIDLAAYLDREGIVVETAERTLVAAREHRWAEPLRHGVRRLLRAGIEQRSGLAIASEATRFTDSDLIIDVGIRRLHGTVDGRVALVADWTLLDTDHDRIVGHHQLVRQITTDADGYPALVAAHVELLEQLAIAIADSLP